MKILLTLTLILLTTHSLHISHKQSPTPYNATTYLSELDQRQAQFKSDIDNIRTQIAQMNGILNSSTLSPADRLRTLSEGMADQRDTLYMIETYLDLPFEIEPCQQVNLTAQQRAQLQTQIDNVNQSLVNLESQVDFCPECPQVLQLKQQIKKQYNYLAIIEATVHSNCLQRPYQFIPENPGGLVNLANSLYKDNLKANNWVYGNITEQDYRMYLFTLSSQFNLTSCPIDTPYVDATSKSCIACLGTYSVGQKKCYPCPSNQHYNFTTSKCEDNPKQCPNGTFLNTTTNQCQPIICPSGLQLDNTTYKCIPICTQGLKLDTVTLKCISICALPQFYNATTKQCQLPAFNCSDGYYYNATTKKCQIIVCDIGYVYDTGSKRCIQKVSNTGSLCPPERPYWNSTAIRCQLCPSAYPIYNAQYNRCQACPAHQVWNPSLGKCQTKCVEGQSYNVTTEQCQTVCPEGKILNTATKVCQTQCPQNTTYNSTSRQCQSISKPPTCKQNSTWNSQLNRCVCNSGFVSNGIDCTLVPVANTTCSVPTPYWNDATGKCESCPWDRPNYSPAIKQCLQPCPAGYVWDNSTFTCSVIQCPNDKPVINFGTGKCEACPQNSTWSQNERVCKKIGGYNYTCPLGYIFNEATKKCQGMTCPSGYHYNSVTKQCQRCEDGYYYNATLAKCYKCPQGTVYNSVSRTCATITCVPGQYYSIKEVKCKVLGSCPDNQYYSTQKQACVNYPECGPTQLLNKATHKCQPAPPCSPNEYYNKATNKCQHANYLTSPSSPNLIYAYNFTQYIGQYNSRRATDPQSRDCPSTAPYYDKNGRVCVSCGTATPYFNLHTSLCQNCGELGYDGAARRCKSNGVTVDPTLQRLIMNIL